MYFFFNGMLRKDVPIRLVSGGRGVAIAFFSLFFPNEMTASLYPALPEDPEK